VDDRRPSTVLDLAKGWAGLSESKAGKSSKKVACRSLVWPESERGRTKERCLSIHLRGYGDKNGTLGQ